MTKPLTIEAIRAAWEKARIPAIEHDTTRRDRGDGWVTHESLRFPPLDAATVEAYAAAPEHIAFLLAEVASLEAYVGMDEVLRLRKELAAAHKHIALLKSGPEMARLVDVQDLVTQLAAARKQIAELEAGR